MASKGTVNIERALRRDSAIENSHKFFVKLDILSNQSKEKFINDITQIFDRAELLPSALSYLAKELRYSETISGNEREKIISRVANRLDELSEYNRQLSPPNRIARDLRDDLVILSHETGKLLDLLEIERIKDDSDL